ENTQKKIKKEYDELLATFSKDIIRPYGLENTTILELKGITLMFMAWFIYNHETYEKESKLIDVYELIVGISKFINNSDGYIGKSLINASSEQNVSKTMLSDLKEWCDELKKKFKFSGSKLNEIAPRLIIYTKYDSIIPSKGF